MINNFIIADIVVVLLPTIITVHSISLSLSKEKIRGTESNNFNLLRNGWYYSFLWMLCTVITIFFVNSLCAFFELKIAVIAIDVIALFYNFHFAIQEIPVLTKNEKAINMLGDKVNATNTK